MKKHLFNSLLHLGVIGLLITTLLAGAMPAQAAPGQHAGSGATAKLLNPDGTLSREAGAKGSLDLTGWKVSLDANRGPVFTPSAAINDGNWSDLSYGTDDEVDAIAVDGNLVYVGGIFRNAGDCGTNATTFVGCDGIAVWDSTTGEWSDVGGGVIYTADGTSGGSVYAIAIQDGKVYVGGDFGKVGDQSGLTVNGIAMWDTQTKEWSDLETGVISGDTENFDPGIVYAITVHGDDVYVGGDFNQAGLCTVCSNIAVWNATNPSNPWSALQETDAELGGVDRDVRAIAVDGNTVYVGGAFQDYYTTGNPGYSESYYVARWDTGTRQWSGLGTGLGYTPETPYCGETPAVYALAVDSQHRLYAGGCIALPDGTDSPTNIYIASWNGSTWSAMGSGLNHPVHAIAVAGSHIFAGGAFTKAGNCTTDATTKLGCDSIAVWDGAGWSDLNGGLRTVPTTIPNGSAGKLSSPLGVTPVNISYGSTYAIAGASGGIYAGGSFNMGNGCSTNPIDPNCNYVAWYDTGLPEIQVSYHSSGDVIPNNGKTPVDFGSTTVGTPISILFDVTNEGTADLTLINVTTAPAGFTVSNFSKTTMAPGESATFTVTLTAAAVGSPSGTVSFADNDPENNPFTFDVTGIVTPIPTPAIQVLDGSTDIPNTTGSVAFGSTLQGTPVSKTLTVKNNGTANLTLTAIASAPAGFSITTNFGATTLAPNATTTFTLQLDASSVGSYSGTVSFANNDATKTPFTFAISGTVTAVPAPAIQVLDGTADVPNTTGVVAFGATPVGTTVSKTLTVKNNGTADLTLTAIAGAPSGFTLTSNFGAATLAPGATTTFTLRLEAGAAGSYGGTVSFANNDAARTPFSFAISGTVTPLADLSVSAAVSQPLALSGMPIVYTLSVTNLGPSDATQAALVDTLPLGLSFTSGAGCSASGATVTCPIGALARQAVKTFSITATSLISVNAVVSNSASVSAQEADPVMSNNTATVQTHIVPLITAYQSQFDQGTDGAWTPGTGTTKSPSGSSFLGELNNQLVSLIVNRLIPHTRVYLLFDLYILRSWDGNTVDNSGDPVINGILSPNKVVGPDHWKLQANGTSLLDTTFTNWVKKGYKQAYPGNYPKDSYPAQSGASAVNTLGYTFDSYAMDSVYSMQYMLPLDTDTMTFDFSSTGLQSLADESWGLANVRVVITGGADLMGFRTFLPCAVK